MHLAQGTASPDPRAVTGDRCWGDSPSAQSRSERPPQETTADARSRLQNRVEAEPFGDAIRCQTGGAASAVAERARDDGLARGSPRSASRPPPSRSPACLGLVVRPCGCLHQIGRPYEPGATVSDGRAAGASADARTAAALERDAITQAPAARYRSRRQAVTASGCGCAGVACCPPGEWPCFGCLDSGHAAGSGGAASIHAPSRGCVPTAASCTAAAPGAPGGRGARSAPKLRRRHWR